ncbi:PEP-CTERM-box response regulator transcription factor [Cellvibrio japonicus]|uniref:Putative PEP-CTERM system response regulator n=1 Tax=Cellvibrio japonicus (strain Ueda107) TaxID=498211 RepID=B3PF85_CELJU|nr:PEP-CTERM-box response regulator transcription factor [Cellvibrio japonicus]ACE83457.1 putative PEP-CTERM system response regulator [Cellvibrio japonicus Ueda107]QEI13636.1 PEP-CTERM-box response regulator transcription factor [Cellvibrio japonicus]QEI17209.1 PEP-CTERM-box response regulator transcription factor [Cellvibrio japonicus]QEI20787.1 PEP-CTERM-box response regulator transcription factor [Cellvibrio japonicus]
MSKSTSKPKLLIIEDDRGLQSQLRWHFDQYETIFAENRQDAISALRLHEAPVVIQDLGLPPDEDGVDEGFKCIQDILRISPNTKIIVMTGKTDKENALRAVAMGAYDFYQKPVDPNTLDLIVQRAFHIFELEDNNRRLSQIQQQPLEGLITNDPQLLKICRQLEKIAPTTVTCTLLGESGTGKEVIARAIHQLSPRKSKRFVAINCAAVPENLIESELFGYEKGAFTGANKTTLGKVETAHEGTLFLDEIGDMPLNLQAKLLRFLQERVIERVGGRTEIPVDVRVVCATNKNLESMVRAGSFREDLFYRICEMTINIPPLRNRMGDKVLLARHFKLKFAKEHGQHVTGFTPDAIAAIESYDWPGNIREMENKVKRAVIMADGKHISREDMGLAEAGELSLNLRHVRQEAERTAILRALSMTDNNISAAAKLLGVTRPTLYDLLKKFDMNLSTVNNNDSEPETIS